MKIFVLLKTLISYILIGIACFIFMPPCIIIAWLPARYRYDNRLFFFWPTIFTKVSF